MAQGVHKSEEWMKSSIPGWHDTFEVAMNLDDVVKFFNTGWHMKEGVVPFRKAAGRYRIFESIARSYDGADLNSFFSNLKTTVVGRGWDEKTVVIEENVLELAEKAKELITT